MARPIRRQAATDRVTRAPVAALLASLALAACGAATTKTVTTGAAAELAAADR
jgi:hypothetical protein